MQEYGKKSDLFGFYFALRALLMFFFLNLFGMFFENIFLWIVVWVLNAFLFLSFFSLLHWCVHNTLFKTKHLNVLFGRIFALLNLDLFSGYKYWHYAHHELTETQVNQEQDNSDRFDNVVSLKTYFLAMFTYFANPVLKLVDYYHTIYLNPKNRERFYSKHSTDFYRDFFLYFLFVLFLIYALCFHVFVVLKIYFIPLFISLPLVFFLDIARHHDTDPNGKTMFEKIRSMEGNWFTKFVTCYANLHLEHHLYPRATPQEIEGIRKEIQPKIIYDEKNYFQYNLLLLKKYFYAKNK